MGIYKKKDRVTVAEAANRLEIKEQAIRKRIQRGTLVHDKDEDGRVYVYLDTSDEVAGTSNGTGKDTHRDKEIDTLVHNLQDQIEYLRAELQRRGETHAEEARRKDTIIAQLAQRIPELPSVATQDTRDMPETASGGGGDAPPEPQEAAQRRSSWWRRFFGFE